MKQKFSLSRGFTLVELMIVIAIIGILAATLYPGLMGYFEGARDTARAGALKNYSLALANFNTATTTFPNGNIQNGPGSPGPSDTTNKTAICIKKLYDDYLKGQYMTTFDKDPQATQGVDVGAAGGNCVGEAKGGYGYMSLQSADNAGNYGNSYLLAAKMEKWDNANYKEGANKIRDINHPNGLNLFQKGSTDSLGMKAKPSSDWILLRTN